MKSALYIYLTAFCALTVSCSETKKQDEANPTTKQDGQNDQPIEGRLELGHKPGTKDSTAYFIKYGNKKYYLGTLFGYHCLIAIPLVGLFWLIGASIRAEQGGAVQPATAPQSKSPEN